MAMAANLREAAYLSYPQCSTFWLAIGGALRTAVNGFITDASPIFEDAVDNDRPVGDWLILLKSLASTLTSVVPISQLNTTVELLYRMCYAGFVNADRGLITNAQAAALLAVWNTRFGT